MILRHTQKLGLAKISNDDALEKSFAFVVYSKHTSKTLDEWNLLQKRIIFEINNFLSSLNNACFQIEVEYRCLIRDNMFCLCGMINICISFN